MPKSTWIVWLLAALAIAGCARLPDGAAPGDGVGGIGETAGKPRYRIDPAASEIRLFVYRGGALARLGHNHVIATGGIDGDVWLGDEPADAVLRLSFDVTEMIIDDPAHRAAAGDDFPGEIDADDVEGTRTNMLSEKLLDGAKHPLIELVATDVRGELPALEIDADVTVRGVTRRLSFPVNARLDGATLRAEGRRTMTHAELGLEPFSVMLGALKVEDEFVAEYRFVAERADVR